jgi:hypothetical protein
MQQCDCHGEKKEKIQKKQLSLMLSYLQIALSLIDRLTC